MITQPPSSDLTVRLAGRAFTPSRVDADRIKSAMGVVIEVLESLLRLLSDERTMQALKEEGNGKALAPARADIERTIQNVHEALRCFGVGNSLSRSYGPSNPTYKSSLPRCSSPSSNAPRTSRRARSIKR